MIRRLFVSHFFARCCSEKTYGHAIIARETRAIIACPCVFTHGHAKIARTHGHAIIARETRAILACPCVFSLVQRAKTCDKI